MIATRIGRVAHADYPGRARLSRAILGVALLSISACGLVGGETNDLTGSRWQLDTVLLGDIPATYKFCPGLLEWETTMIAYLESAKSFEQDAGELRLFVNASPGPIMVFSLVD